MFLTIWLILILFSFAYCTHCACNQPTCNYQINNGDCSGDYCFGYRASSSAEVSQKGCLTTPNYIDNITCEENINGELFCICKTDFCNTQAMKKEPLIKLPEITCPVVDVAHPARNTTCMGHSWSIRTQLELQHFGDLKAVTSFSGCDFDEIGSALKFSQTITRYGIDVDPNVESACFLMIYVQGESKLICDCKTDFCTHYSLSPPITMGNVECYLFYSFTGKHGKCKGHFCFTETEEAMQTTHLGCLSLWKSNNSTFDMGLRQIGGRKTTFCDYDFCNGFDNFSQSNSNIFVFLVLLLIGRDIN